jgi:aldose sugar dehydrogenase
VATAHLHRCVSLLLAVLLMLALPAAASAQMGGDPWPGPMPAPADTNVMPYATDPIPGQELRPAYDANPLPLGGVEHVVLTEQVEDPTSIEVADDGRVFIAERKGHIRVWHQDGTLEEIGWIDTSAAACSFCSDTGNEEGGIHGLLLDRDFAETNLLYVYYSVPSSDVELDTVWTPALGEQPLDPAEGVQRLSTFELDADGKLDLGSETVILENPAHWEQCCHYAGDLEWMPDGTVVLSTGDDAAHSESDGYSPHDRRPGREEANAERTSQNPLDRRGKILRFNPDGTVPDDNPHVGDDGYDPYVYAMGFRNPYRISVGPDGSVYVGNVGPDAFVANPNRGPQGFDEWERIPPAGGTNHGWPWCIADNKPYIEYDFASGTSGEPFDCSGMIPAEVYYPYLQSTEFPTITYSGPLRAAMMGPIYDHDGTGALALPAAFRDKLIVGEFGRRNLHAVSLDADGSMTAEIFPFMLALRSPIDFEVGPDGALYVVEYGFGFYNNADSRISRITCLACDPDPADYGGDVAVLAAAVSNLDDDGLRRSGLDPRMTLLAVALLLALGVPLRRRVA